VGLNLIKDCKAFDQVSPHLSLRNSSFYDQQFSSMLTLILTFKKLKQVDMEFLKFLW
jgi:hypothetical protein